MPPGGALFIICHISLGSLRAKRNCSMTKNNPRPVRKSLPLYACQAKRTIGADPHASPMCSTFLSLDACRSNSVSGLLKSVFVICSYLLSLDAHHSKCVFYMLKCALARRPSINMRFLCAQRYSRSTTVNPNAFSFGKVYLGLKMA